MTPTAAPAQPTSSRALRASETPTVSGPVTDDAIRALGSAIHAELRESLSPEDIVRLTSDLLARVTAELQAARHAKT